MNSLRVQHIGEEDIVGLVKRYLKNETQYIDSGILYLYFIVKGSSYPFDPIIPYLRVDLPFNVTKDKVKVEYCINDADASYVYEEGNVNLRVKNLPGGSSIHVNIALNKKPIWAVPIVTPILIGYLILGASVIMKRKEDASSHLTAYLSVLTISLTLFFRITETIPSRPTLSIAEILILSLMMSTSFFYHLRNGE